MDVPRCPIEPLVKEVKLRMTARFGAEVKVAKSIIRAKTTLMLKLFIVGPWRISSLWLNQA
jgi:hypothetical protein